MLPSLICTLPMSVRQMPFRFIKARHVLLFLCLLSIQLVSRTASGLTGDQRLVPIPRAPAES